MAPIIVTTWNFLNLSALNKILASIKQLSEFPIRQLRGINCNEHQRLSEHH